jgi:Kef-type K+ transport system membrane component KefB
MTEIWTQAALWLGLALIASLLSIWLRIATALSEIVIGTIAQLLIGVYPVTRAFQSPRQEGMYTTLLMSTGLTFGTISALFGLSHQIVDQAQYSALVAAVIGSAVVPTLIANAFFCFGA